MMISWENRPADIQNEVGMPAEKQLEGNVILRGEISMEQFRITSSIDFDQNSAESSG
jgi:hypothetical protein